MRLLGKSKVKNQEDVEEITLSPTDLGLLKEANEYLSTNLENRRVEERREHFRVYDRDEITEATTVTTETGSTGTNSRSMLLPDLLFCCGALRQDGDNETFFSNSTITTVPYYNDEYWALEASSKAQTTQIQSNRMNGVDNNASNLRRQEFESRQDRETRTVNSSATSKRCDDKILVKQADLAAMKDQLSTLRSNLRLLQKVKESEKIETNFGGVSNKEVVSLRRNSRSFKSQVQLKQQTPAPLKAPVSPKPKPQNLHIYNTKKK